MKPMFFLHRRNVMVGDTRKGQMKVLTVFGTRPEAIKMAPIIMELQRRSDPASPDYHPALVSKVCVTAQHREMLDQVLRQFDIAPDHDLDVMARNQTPTRVASTVLARLEPILKQEEPDWVLVQGDTTTAPMAALAAFYAGARVGHVEAGLRTFDKWRPFPEEVNRKVAGVIADMHYVPTSRSRQNLLAEQIPEEIIVVTGNPVVDALNWVSEQPLPEGATDQERELMTWLADQQEGQRLILVTAHHRENFLGPLEDICHALTELAERYGEALRMVYPVHLNPNIWEPVHRMLGDVPNISLIPPLDYLPLVHVMKRAHLVLTDSGGIQEEAPGLGKPVLVLREKTERPEAVDAGAVLLVGTDPARIFNETVKLMDSEAAYQQMARAVNPYGDGRAAERIVKVLLQEDVDPFDPA